MNLEEQLLIKLDQAARSFNPLEYGLPITENIPKSFISLVTEYYQTKLKSMNKSGKNKKL